MNTTRNISWVLGHYIFFSYKKETLEYEKVFEEDNEFKEKEIAQLTETNKRLEQKLTESKKEIKEVTALLDKEKVMRSPNWLLSADRKNLKKSMMNTKK